MFGLGPTELIVLVVLAILVLGPQKIPAAAAQLGKAIRQFRKASHALQDEIDHDGTLGRSVSDLRAALHGDPSKPAAPQAQKAPPTDAVAQDAEIPLVQEKSSP